MKLWAISGILFLSLLFIGWAYYNSTQERIKVLTENAVRLEENVKTVQRANETNLKTIDELTASYERIERDYLELQEEFQTIRQQRQELSFRLDRDIDRLSEGKTSLMEDIINRANRDMMRCFEIQSGAPLTETEQSAESARDFNSECPWLRSEYAN